MSAEIISPAPAAKPERQNKFWESLDGSVAIYLTFEVIDAINLALAQIAAAPPFYGAEVGGLLLGKREQRNKLTVWIEHFEPVACSYPRGASWMLSENEEAELRTRLAKPCDPYTVGFFRSHTRKDLCLSEDDVSLFSRLFADSANVFLLVKPFVTRPSIGSFFCWEGGVLRRTNGHFAFPFKRSELPGALPSEPYEQLDAPMFLRLEKHEQTARGSLLRKLGYVVGLGIICVAGYVAYSRYEGKSLDGKLARGAEQPEATLRLSTAEDEKNITLKWDRTSPIIAATTHGAVEITEGSFHKRLEMGRADFRVGRVIYSRANPTSNTVSFRVLLDTGQGEPFSEVVRFIAKEPVAIVPVPLRVALPDFKEVAAEPVPVELPKVVAPRDAAPSAAAPPVVRPAPRREP